MNKFYSFFSSYFFTKNYFFLGYTANYRTFYIICLLYITRGVFTVNITNEIKIKALNIFSKQRDVKMGACSTGILCATSETWACTCWKRKRKVGCEGEKELRKVR